MTENPGYHQKSLLPGILALTGIAIGLLLSLLAVWADYEATSYGFPRRAQAPFRGLTCPVFMGRNESKTVYLEISNPTDRNLSPGIRTQISTSDEPISKVESIRLVPGEKMTIQRTVGPDNIDLGMFIFVDALVYAAYPLPDREATCGILVLPVPNGTYPLIIGTALSILFMAAGTYLLYKKALSGGRSRSILFMVIATLFAILFGYLGWSFAAFVLNIVLILTLLVSSGNLFTSQTKG
jgi:hypothetical protein